MIKNYFITAYRNLARNKVYAILNVAGLALGIGCAIVIYKVLSYELSFDQHHSNYDNIYRVVRTTHRADGTSHDSGSPHPMGEAIKAEFPSVREAAMVDYQPQQQINIPLENGGYNRYLEEYGVTYAQPSIFKILDFYFLAGNPAEALKNPKEVILSYSWMNKFFGYDRRQAELALGKSVNLADKVYLTVVGVYEDFPATTDFPFQLIATYDTQAFTNRYYHEGKVWRSVSSSTNCLVLLNEEIDPTSIERQLPNLIDKYIEEGESQVLSLSLQPLREIHFNSTYYNYPERSVSKQILLALAIIGLILVVTACINFINLATAQAVKRSKEIGIRKVLGGFRTQLIVQFLSETTIITFFSVLVSFGIAEVLLINLVDILTYRLHLDLLSEPVTILFLLGLTIFVALLSGLYPSLLLSRVDAINAIKTRLTTATAGGYSIRRALVIFQFTISQLLIICTLIVWSQMDFFRTKELGFNTENIILTYLPDNDKQKLERLKQGLSSHPEVRSVSYSLSAPTGQSDAFSNFNYAPANFEDDLHANFKFVDEHYIDLYDLPIIAGRKLTETDSNGVIVNLELLRTIGINTPEEALGESLSGGGLSGLNKLTIVGVVDDFHTRSLDEGLDMVIIQYGPKIFFEAAVRFNDLRSGLESARSIVESEWLKVFPEFVFDFDFYDRQLAERYEDEQSIAKLLTIFSVIAVFIGCLGLYGLVTFMANQKIKEIGVRKVLGASLLDILKIFSREMILLMVIAFVVAIPIGIYSMDQWLDNFKYRIPLTPDIFIIALLVSFLIATATMGYRSVKASLANPSESLKDE